ncbi:MAG TPA: glycoside hydrolase family 76 protein [Polyangiaceae bacterium]|nr:glycoside hydrolase family 76 protein [Polyangiaceae bacterium]
MALGLVACAPGAGGGENSGAAGSANSAAGSEASAGTAALVGGAAANAGQGGSAPSAGGSMGGSGGASSSGGSAGEVASGNGGQASGTPMFPPLILDCDVPAAHQHADRALEIMLLDFWSGTDQYLHAITPSDGKLTGYWTYAQAFDALLDGVERTGSSKYLGLLSALYAGRGARGWLVDYYDDEAWMTMALLRAFDLTGDRRYLDTAETIFKDIMTAWDTTCCGDHKGGIWWDHQHSSKATASNGGPAIAGVRLAARTKSSAYLDFAKQVYGFWMTDMVNQQTWAIYDHLSPDGTRNPGALTYNHGLMIGAGLELSEATGEAHYLNESHQFAAYMMAHGVKTSSLGPVLNDFGNNCEGDCAAWKGIGYRYLALLFRKDPTHTDYATFLKNNATAVWTLARDPATDLFSSSWAGPAQTGGGIEKQGSAAMALNLYALLCGSDPRASFAAPGVYEAEEAAIDHVSLEAKYQGFSGFGYVAAFAKDKQGIAFEVTVAKAGSYQLEWRYAAGAGAAVRSVLVASQVLTPSQAFAATADWNTWSSASATVRLPEGASLIELRFDASKGSSGALNVDRVTLTPQ